MLILDEPTNHLDIDSRAALIEAINDYRGAIILVSHDRYLLDACADRLWLVEDQTVTPFDGDIDAYKKYVLEGAGSGNGRPVKTGRGEARKSAPARPESPRTMKKTVLPSKRISAIEDRMRKFKDLIARIDETLARPAAFTKDPAKAALLSSQRGELERLLGAAEEEWLSLAGTLETLPDAAVRIK